MAGRLSTICAVLSVALLLYAVSVVLIGRQISRKLIHIEITKAVPPPAPPADGRINVLGVRVPLEVVWLVGVSGPTWLVSSMVWRQVTRRRRERSGKCLNCGHALTARRGRCPGCRAWHER